MTDHSLFEYYNLMTQNKMNIIYMGPMWTDGIGELGFTLKRFLEIEDIPYITSQAVFSVFVEQMNNIVYYSVDKESQHNNKIASKGIFTLSTHDKKYLIQAGNKMNKKSIALIKERIDLLNTMNKEELRKYYRERMLTKDENSESRGAGLGLIEIAKRTSEPIQYNFVDIDENVSFFSMSVTISY